MILIILCRADFPVCLLLRNAYSAKTLKTTFGDVPIEVSRDREASFNPKVIPKSTTNVSGIENKVLSMYVKGISRRDKRCPGLMAERNGKQTQLDADF